MFAEQTSTWAKRTAKVVLLISILAGWVFLSEGIQKFLFPDSLGVGRFVKIGILWPHVMAPFVGVVEIVCGTLLLIGFLSGLLRYRSSLILPLPYIRPKSSRSPRTGFGALCTKPART
jgi:putative oxidoreductase